MVNNLNEDMDRTKMKMVKLDTRLKNYVAASSPCYLTIVIVIEIIVLTMIILVF